MQHHEPGTGAGSARTDEIPPGRQREPVVAATRAEVDHLRRDDPVVAPGEDGHLMSSRPRRARAGRGKAGDRPARHGVAGIGSARSGVAGLAAACAQARDQRYPRHRSGYPVHVSQTLAGPPGFRAKRSGRARSLPRAHERFAGPGYQDGAQLPKEISLAWLEQAFGTAESARQFQRLLTSLRARDLLAIEPALARLQVPTLIVWGTGDRFFHRKWAYWLRDTIPGASEVVEIDGGRLFFPDERAAEFTAALRRHWANHP
jgi:pimeloyl-ACP methyl ester carboxylesterase